MANHGKETSNNKIVIDAITAQMEKIMDEKLKVICDELKSQKKTSNGEAASHVETRPKQLDKTWSNPYPDSHTPKHLVTLKSDYQFGDEFSLYAFSGKGNYKDWERNIEEWFCYNHILKEKRLPYAVGQLNGDAYQWFLQEQDDRRYYRESTITSWNYLKELPRDKYARKD